jgi:hypothetical protein
VKKIGMGWLKSFGPQLSQAMGKILQARGGSVFLLDCAKSPAQLGPTFLG